ncbi:stalk domain-containing protein [Paenibacillus sp. strain BS8-2]
MKRKTVVWLVVPAMLISFAVGASASTGLEKISAHLNYNLKFKIDGKVWKPVKDDGLSIAPITYQGTTYLPARAIAEALDVVVGYDAATSTVLFGEVVDGTPVTEEVIEPSYGITHTKDQKRTIVGGKDYKEVYYAEDVGSYFGESLMFHPKKKYQTLYLQVASIQQDLIIEVYEGETPVQIMQTSIENGSDMNTIEIDVGGLDSVLVVMKTFPEAEFSDIYVSSTSYYK